MLLIFRSNIPLHTHKNLKEGIHCRLFPSPCDHRSVTTQNVGRLTLWPRRFHSYHSCLNRLSATVSVKVRNTPAEIWYPHTELNCDLWFRKPLLYPFELWGLLKRANCLLHTVRHTHVSTRLFGFKSYIHLLPNSPPTMNNNICQISAHHTHGVHQ